MATDKKLSSLVINTLTQAQYDSATKSEDELYLTPDDTDEQLANKQDALTTAQLNACNSGITADRVALYDNFPTQISAKQDKLVSGTNIKTVNGNSLLGSGNIEISGGGDTDHSMHTFDLHVLSDSTSMYKLMIICNNIQLTTIKNALMQQMSIDTWEECKSTIQSYWSNMDASTRISQLITNFAQLMITVGTPVYLLNVIDGGIVPCYIYNDLRSYVIYLNFPESFTSSEATGIKWLNVSTTLASCNTLDILIDE